MTYIIFFLSGWVLGIIICKQYLTLNHSKDIAEKLAEVAREKEELRQGLSENLSTIRSGLIQAVSAYGQAVNLVQNKLPTNDNPTLHLELRVEDNSEELKVTEELPATEATNQFEL